MKLVVTYFLSTRNSHTHLVRFTYLVLTTIALPIAMDLALGLASACFLLTNFDVCATYYALLLTHAFSAVRNK